MMIYNLLLLFIIFISSIEFLKKKKSLSLFVPIVILLITITALRGNGGSDFIVYEKYFQSLPNELYNYGYGYLFLNKFTAYFGDYHLLIIITSVISISLQSIYIYKETRYPSITFLILYSTSFILLNFILIRQAIAIGFILLSFLFYKKEKNVPSLLFAIIAITFHETAIFVLLLFIAIEKSPKVISYIFIISIIMAVPFFKDIILLVNELTINNKNLLGYINEKSLPSSANLIEVSLAIICYIILKNRKIFSNERECHIYYSIIVSSIIILILSYSIQPLARFLEYYRIIFFILYIKLFEHLNNNSKIIFFIMLLLYCIARLNSFIIQYDNGFEYIFYGI
ncbi:EpsG family protein [Morganella morganii]|uniref:EpsG family protein n=1 Tax=Morganella morganii TaxID=582 RepID=A0A9Q4CPS0_MORMO|nr:EpsG family protein [Morganella morganii]MCY0791180.1 EpsG family protein [Morganella morganii]